MTTLSGSVTFVLFFLVFVFMLSLKPRPFVQSFFDSQSPQYAHVFFSDFLLSVYLKMTLFPSIFCALAAFSLNGEYVVRSFLPNCVFLPCDGGLDF